MSKLITGDAAEQLFTMVKDGTLTVNEARTQMDLEPLSGDLVPTIIGVDPGAAGSDRSGIYTSSPQWIKAEAIRVIFDDLRQQQTVALSSVSTAASNTALKLKDLSVSFSGVSQAIANLNLVINPTYIPWWPEEGDPVTEHEWRPPDPIPEALDPDLWLQSVSRSLPNT